MKGLPDPTLTMLPGDRLASAFAAGIVKPTARAAALRLLQRAEPCQKPTLAATAVDKRKARQQAARQARKKTQRA